MHLMTDEERKLYPLRFCTLEDTYDWGEDTFKVADLGYRDSLVKEGWLGANTLSEVMDTYLDRVAGDRVYEVYGRQFPVQVKHIRCHGVMALRAHPCDETARERYDALGREKLWYVASAGKNAVLYLGLKEKTDAASLLDGSFTAKLNAVHPEAGQSFIIPSGTIHGAEGEVEIVEVSESSALDFCVWSWGKAVSEEEFDPSMDVVEALDFLNLDAYRTSGTDKAPDTPGFVEPLASLQQFCVNKIALKDIVRISSGSRDSFALYFCLYGKAAVRCDIEGIGPQDFTIGQGDAILVPAELSEYLLVPLNQSASLLEVFVETKEDDE